MEPQINNKAKASLKTPFRYCVRTKRKLKVRKLQEHLIVIITATYLAYSEVASN